MRNSCQPRAHPSKTAVNFFVAQTFRDLYNAASQIDSLFRFRGPHSRFSYLEEIIKCISYDLRSWPFYFCPVLGIVRASAQSATASEGVTMSESAPKKVEHFDLGLIDKSLDPCQDFYQYACSKWNAANPIPPDQAAWGTAAACSIGMRTSCGRPGEAAAQSSGRKRL